MLDTELADIREDLYKYIHRQTGDEEKASDITQEAFLRVINKGVDSEDIDQFRAYLFHSAYNFMIDIHRQQKRQPIQEPIDEEYQIIFSDVDDNSLENVIKKNGNPAYWI